VADLVQANDVVEEIRSTGQEAISIETDVSAASSVERLAEEVTARFGRIDILVNNAGHFRDAQRGVPFEEISEEEWERAFAVNVRGTWLTSKAVVPHMKAQRSGRIVNVSSQVVMRGTAGFLHYVAAKAAIIGLTRAMARELGDHGIGVNAIAPDWIPHDLEYAADHPEVDERIVATRAFKRTMVPEDLVGTVLFLVGADSRFITGQTILVNGGSIFQ
jgi:NAD(P)-dependent dehydrogenase (short-subunit alcohol dehydrogenase family)